LIFDYFYVPKETKMKRKWSVQGWCAGAVAALVAITPAAGFVPPWSAFLIGLIGSLLCNFATSLKHLPGIDEPLDVFALHAVGGMVGNLLTYHSWVIYTNSVESLRPTTLRLWMVGPRFQADG
jgi:ammonia channel protein AmtB